MVRTAKISGIILICLVARPAYASEGSLSATDTLITEYRADNKNEQEDDDNYGVVINRLNVDASSGDINGHARVDGAAFQQPPSDSYKHDLRLERLRLDLRTGDLKMTGGDFFRQLGRGIVLSIRKEDEIGLDRSIRGADLQYSSDIQQANLFAGHINPANLDAISQKYVRDPGDGLVGGSYELRAIEPLALGLFGLYLQPRERILDEVDYTQAGGAYLEAPALTEWLGLYLEGDAQRKMLAGEEQTGYAAYGTADARAGDTSLLLEGIYLVGYTGEERSPAGFEMRGSENTALQSRFIYNRPPTLQRVEEEVLNNYDAVGGRMRVAHYLESLDLEIFANGLLRYESHGQPDQIRQLHGWGGGELNLGGGPSHINLSGGYRDENQQSRQIKSMIHGDLDLLVAIIRDYALHFVSNTEFRTLERRDYVRGSTFYGVEYGRYGSLTFELGYDTQNPSDRVRRFFFAGILTCEIIDALKLSATLGTQRGGIKCISGVCREYPAFAGGRLEMVGRL
jgi:hypothetical protein